MFTARRSRRWAGGGSVRLVLGLGSACTHCSRAAQTSAAAASFTGEHQFQWQICLISTFTNQRIYKIKEVVCRTAVWNNYTKHLYFILYDKNVRRQRKLVHTVSYVFSFKYFNIMLRRKHPYSLGDACNFQFHGTYLAFVMWMQEMELKWPLMKAWCDKWYPRYLVNLIGHWG